MASAGTPRSDAAEAAAVLAAFKQSAADTQAFHAANPLHDARHDARTGPRGPSGSLSGPPCGCTQAECRKLRGPCELRRPRSARSGRWSAARATGGTVRHQSGRRHLRHRRHGPRGRRSLSARARLSSAAAKTTRSTASRGSSRARKALRHAASNRARPALLQRPEWFGRRSAARATGGTVRAAAARPPYGPLLDRTSGPAAVRSAAHSRPARLVPRCRGRRVRRGDAGRGAGLGRGPTQRPRGVSGAAVATPARIS